MVHERVHRNASASEDRRSAHDQRIGVVYLGPIHAGLSVETFRLVERLRVSSDPLT